MSEEEEFTKRKSPMNEPGQRTFMTTRLGSHSPKTQRKSSMSPLVYGNKEYIEKVKNYPRITFDKRKSTKFMQKKRVLD